MKRDPIGSPDDVYEGELAFWPEVRKERPEGGVAAAAVRRQGDEKPPYSVGI